MGYNKTIKKPLKFIKSEESINKNEHHKLAQYHSEQSTKYNDLADEHSKSDNKKSKQFRKIASHHEALEEHFKGLSNQLHGRVKLEKTLTADLEWLLQATLLK